jgi:high-affinity iron transporter
MNIVSLALQSGAILLREGLEALLIISALAAFLRRASAQHALSALYAGAGLAVIASLAGAVITAIYLDGAHDDRVEALIMTAAALLMLYMSGWLFLRQDPRVMMAGLKRSAEVAATSGTALSFASVAFLAVFREGAETVLFLQALAQTNGGWSIGLVGGIAGAAVLLAAAYVAMQWFALQLPLRPLFLATSAFLFVMALKFIGQAVQELQEQLLVSVTAADLPGWMISLGFNASWEALGVQIAIALIAVASTGMAYAAQHRAEAGNAGAGAPAE